MPLLDRAEFLKEFPDAVFFGIATESLLGDEEVWSANLEYRVKRAICLIRPLDRAQIFTRVSGWSFARGSYGISTR